MSPGTQHTNEQPECPDYSLVFWVLGDITLTTRYVYHNQKLWLKWTPINDLYS